jgi:hypothetical protein
MIAERGKKQNGTLTRYKSPEIVPRARFLQGSRNESRTHKMGSAYIFM